MARGFSPMSLVPEIPDPREFSTNEVIIVDNHPTRWYTLYTTQCYAASAQTDGIWYFATSR